MDLHTLKENLTNIMPILNANLEAAHTEYMNGELPSGAYHHVLSRHGTANAVLLRDDISADVAYKACAMLTIDLYSGIKNSPNKKEDHEKLEAWRACYREAGFTGMHKLFAIPTLPDETDLPVHGSTSQF